MHGQTENIFQSLKASEAVYIAEELVPKRKIYPDEALREPENPVRLPGLSLKDRAFRFRQILPYLKILLPKLRHYFLISNSSADASVLNPDSGILALKLPRCHNRLPL